MLIHIAAFEVKQRLRAVSTYVYFGVLFALSVFFVAATGGAIKGAVVDFGTGSKVNVNSPFSLNSLMALIASFATPIVAAIAGRAVFQDVDHRSTAFFFTKPISKLDYLGGRFFGAFAVVIGIHASLGLGALACVHAGIVDATRVGSETVWSYLEPYALVLVPNVFFTTALFFATAALTKKMAPVYVGGVLLTLGYFIGTNLADEISHRQIAALADPFGLQAIERLTEYWTVAERSTRLLPFAGLLAKNRLLWAAVASVLLLVTYLRFRFDEPRVTTRLDAAREPLLPGAFATTAEPAPTFSTPKPTYSPRASLALLARLTFLHLRETVKNVFFLVLVLAGLLFVVAVVLDGQNLYGTRTYPVTYQVLELVEQAFNVFILIITTFYAGELAFRERDARMAEIVDALPAPRSVLFVSKLLALFAVQGLLVTLVMAAGVFTQVVSGFYDFELPLYMEKLFLVSLPRYFILATLAIFVHAVVDNKYVGHFVMVLYLLVSIALPLVGFEDPLFRFASSVDSRYSAMNGFGHFAVPIAWLLAYWSCAAIALGVVSYLLWVRGTERTLARRLGLARARWTGTTRTLFVAALAAYLAIGGYLFVNTHIRNPFLTSYEKDDIHARFEKKYKPHEDDARLTMRSAKLEVDIDPPLRGASIRGAYVVENKTNVPISSIAVTLEPRARIKRLGPSRAARVALDDLALGFHVYDFEQPLLPGETSTLEFDIAYEQKGFVLRGADNHFAENGTFFAVEYLPAIGYQTGRELADDEIRRRHGLSPKYLRERDDPIGLLRNDAGADIDYVTFDAVVSTTPDQIGIAPGVMDREWISGGRRYFHYRVDTPVLNYFGFLSGRYAVRRDAWKDVVIEIDYHPSHDYNLDRMIDGVKRSLDYFTTNFGPYQHKQVRIVEFPRYETLAMSLAAMIPFSESIGFIAKVDEKDRDDVDYPFYVTAHEVAHQWWAHQIIGADVQGGGVLTDSFCQYSALMVMKHAKGAAAMRKYLRYELDRYLRGRGSAKKREQPLGREENDGYIHYAKGTLVMYALQDAVGEDVVNGVLRRMLARFAYQVPYPTTLDFEHELGVAIPPAYLGLVHDLFEEITIFDNHVTKATVKDIGEDEHEVHIEALAKKLRADELGAESEVQLDDIIEVGVLDGQGNVVAVEKVHVTGDRVDVTMKVHGEAVKAGIDPRSMLIDRKPDDNVMPLARE
jgi:ABC-type transport system involved in multi-copper enzyme maturation permease subunit